MTTPSLEDMPVDQLVTVAREYQGSHTLLHTLLSNKETRETVQRALKKVNPALVIPEIEAADRVSAELDTMKKSNEEMAAKIQEREIRDRLERQRAAVMAKHNLTEGDMLEVEKLMTDKDNPIPSYDAAARVLKAERATAAPTAANISPPMFQMPEKDIWGKGIGNKAALDRIAMDEAYKALNEIRSGKVAA